MRLCARYAWFHMVSNGFRFTLNGICISPCKVPFRNELPDFPGLRPGRFGQMCHEMCHDIMTSWHHDIMQSWHVSSGMFWTSGLTPKSQWQLLLVAPSGFNFPTSLASSVAVFVGFMFSSGILRSFLCLVLQLMSKIDTYAYKYHQISIVLCMLWNVWFMIVSRAKTWGKELSQKRGWAYIEIAHLDESWHVKRLLARDWKVLEAVEQNRDLNPTISAIPWSFHDHSMIIDFPWFSQVLRLSTLGRQRVLRSAARWQRWQPRLQSRQCERCGTLAGCLKRFDTNRLMQVREPHEGMKNTQWAQTESVTESFWTWHPSTCFYRAKTLHHAKLR